MSLLSYKDSGVDIDAGNAFVEAIKPFVKATATPHVIGGIGSFAGACGLPSGYKNPVLLASTDGVGTKLRLAIDSGRLESVGIDLVAMCVNDLICNFAEPLFFLDYYATGKLEIAEAASVIKGIALGCQEAECALIGGETAEMPGMYHGKDFDLAGFSVGIAEREEMNRTHTLAPGDLLIALPSSGIHSNGYSLVRKLFFEKLGMGFESEFLGEPLIDVLLRPTRIYVKFFKAHKPRIKAIAHITGGGILENLPRVLPAHLCAKIAKNSLRILPIFQEIGKHVEGQEMLRTFNMGIGAIVVCAKEDADAILAGSDGYLIGEPASGAPEVHLS